MKSGCITLSCGDYREVSYSSWGIVGIMEKSTCITLNCRDVGKVRSQCGGLWGLQRGQVV